MMEGSETEKRIALDDSDTKSFEPILVKLDKRGCAPYDIHIDKDEFKIGRAKDSDEIILDVTISRRHCIFRCQGNEEWTIKDLSSSVTFVNDVPLTFGVPQRLNEGDIVQFSTSSEFKYRFTLAAKEERRVKRPRIDEQIMSNVLIDQRTFAESQECQKKVLKDKLELKQKEQDELKQQLEELLKQQNVTKEDTEELRKQIALLEGKIENGNIQEKHLQNMYAELLEKLENERIQFEKRLNEEKEKWQQALDVSKQEKETLEIKMKEQMEKWNEEKNIQAQLLNEKTVLEEKLKETEKALKEQEAKAVTNQNNVAGPSDYSADNCIFFEIVSDPSAFPVLDTIDLTVDMENQVNIEKEQKESVLNKVNDIMDEQLTCTICSELFVKATTLKCMHSFCQYCINSWSGRKRECPVCRAPIASMNRSIVLDNFIESMLENLPTKFKEKRKEVIEERKRLEMAITKKKYRQKF